MDFSWPSRSSSSRRIDPMRVRLFSLLLCVAGLAVVESRAQLQAAHIRVDALYETQQLVTRIERGFLSSSTTSEWRPKAEIQKSAGAAWALRLDGRPCLVTAAHVLLLNTVPSFDEPQVPASQRRKLERRRLWIYAGDLAHEPERISWLPSTQALGPDDRADVVALFFRPENEQVFSNLRFYELATRVPQAGETVSLIGFPGTFVAQITEARVAHADARSGIMVVNRAVEHGDSGGAALDRDNRVVGVITAIGKGQTTIQLLTREQLLAAVPFAYAKLNQPHPFTGSAAF